MKSLKESILFESLDELYHFTNISNLLEICRKDEFVCSEDDGHNEFNYDYYISTSRQRNALTGYPTGMIDRKIARIVLDGRKLNSKFKIKSIDFMKSKGYPIKANWGNKELFDKNFTTIMLQTQEENEDRVYSKDEFIKNFHKYIKELQIDLTTITDTEIKFLTSYCEKYNIKLNIMPSKRFLYGK